MGIRLSDNQVDRVILWAMNIVNIERA